MCEQSFDVLLENCLSELPPDDVVRNVTPWRKAMRQIILGLAMNLVTLQFFALQYILPSIGVVLQLLGFRTLYRENKWFGACLWLTALQCFWQLSSLAVNVTVYQRELSALPLLRVLGAVILILEFMLYFCFWKALCAVKTRAGMPARAGGAAGLMVWYVLLCVLALMQYEGIAFMLLLLVGYAVILRSLYRLSGELEEAGYAVRPTRVRFTDWALVGAITALTAAGVGFGFCFFQSYDMDWTALDAAEHELVEEVKVHLAELGVPNYVLNDLAPHDLEICRGALQAVVDVEQFPVNEGRSVTQRSSGVLRTYRVYDAEELQITGVAVQLPAEREQWLVIHHFCMTEDPGFYGTEAIQLWPSYRMNQGWYGDDTFTGRLLYDCGGVTYTAPYHSLGAQTYTSNSIFWGEQTSTECIATFSMPRDGENWRGYVAYVSKENVDGWILDSWFNYVHQTGWLQYPVISARDYITNGRSGDVFQVVESALQAYVHLENPVPLG